MGETNTDELITAKDRRYWHNLLSNLLPDV